MGKYAKLTLTDELGYNYHHYLQFADSEQYEQARAAVARGISHPWLDVSAAELREISERDYMDTARKALFNWEIFADPIGADELGLGVPCYGFEF